MLAIFFGTSSLCTTLIEVTQSHSQCIYSLYTAYDRISENLNQLIRMNDEALKLRRQYKITKLKLQAAYATGRAVQISIYEAQIAAIEFKKAALDTQQKLQLERAELERQKMIVNTKKIWGKKLLSATSRELLVRPDIPGDLAPVYLVDASLKKSQVAQISFKNKSGPYSCAVSLEKRSDLYRATLAEVKHDL